MSVRDRITAVVSGGAISAMLGMGSYSANARIDDLQADIRELKPFIVGAESRDAPTD